MDSSLKPNANSLTAKQQYRTLKRRFKFLVYENECYQEQLRNLQRKLLKLSRDKNFLLDRLQNFEKVSDSSDDSDTPVETTVQPIDNLNGIKKKGKEPQPTVPSTVKLVEKSTANTSSAPKRKRIRNKPQTTVTSLQQQSNNNVNLAGQTGTLQQQQNVVKKKKGATNGAPKLMANPPNSSFGGPAPPNSGFQGPNVSAMFVSGGGPPTSGGTSAFSAPNSVSQFNNQGPTTLAFVSTPSSAPAVMYSTSMNNQSSNFTTNPSMQTFVSKPQETSASELITILSDNSTLQLQNNQFQQPQMILHQQNMMNHQQQQSPVGSMQSGGRSAFVAAKQAQQQQYTVGGTVGSTVVVSQPNQPTNQQQSQELYPQTIDIP